MATAALRCQPIPKGRSLLLTPSHPTQRVNR